MNFLEETKESIHESKHRPSDIIFIGSEETGHCCAWDKFCRIADFDYINYSGWPKIPLDLVIAFSDGSKLARGEFNDAECWDYSKPFKLPLSVLELSNVKTTAPYWCIAQNPQC